MILVIRLSARGKRLSLTSDNNTRPVLRDLRLMRILDSELVHSKRPHPLGISWLSHTDGDNACRVRGPESRRLAPSGGWERLLLHPLPGPVARGHGLKRIHYALA